MKYILLMYADETRAPRTPEEYQAVAPAWTNLRQELSAAGLLLSNNDARAVGQDVDHRGSQEQ